MFLEEIHEKVKAEQEVERERIQEIEREREAEPIYEQAFGLEAAE